MEYNVPELRMKLLGVIESNPNSFRQYAIAIGVTQHTLLNFLYEKREPSRMTLNKIDIYLKRRPQPRIRLDMYERRMEEVKNKKNNRP